MTFKQQAGIGFVLMLVLVLVFGAFAPGCGGDDGGRLSVGQEQAGEGARGSGSAGSFANPNGDNPNGDNDKPHMAATGTSELTAHVEDPAGLEIDIVTLRCAGDCADVMAVARGGNPEYSFAWEDGSATAARTLCADATRAFHVTVSDTAIESDEFHYDAHSATADVTAEVLDCQPTPNDGGVDETACERPTDEFVTDAQGENPSGNWSYGWTDVLGGAFTRYPTYQAFTSIDEGPYQGPGWPEITQWFDESLGKVTADSYYSVPPVPDVQFNAKTTAVHPADGNLAGSSWTLAPGQLALSPAAGAQLSVVRWTAPSAGDYVLHAAFDGLCGDNGAPVATADTHVLQNGKELGGGRLNADSTGNSFAFEQSIALQAGDTIDFAVGSDGGLFICPDVTALDARICARTAE